MTTSNDCETKSVAAEGLFCPHKLISLADMIPFYASDTYVKLSFLQVYVQITVFGRDVTSFVKDDFAKSYLEKLSALDESLAKISIPVSRERIKQTAYPLRMQVEFHQSADLSYDVFRHNIDDLCATVISELKEHAFAYIPKAQAAYFEKDSLFGDAVALAFPSVKVELKEAGNCLAADLNTAAVFHLMRVAERGMRVLAHDRRVKFDKGPIETQEWKPIIVQLEKEIAKVSNWPKSKQRAQAEEFYNTALEEFRGFKDAWRNHVMHARRNYNDKDAAGVLSHVCRFMQLLSARISETTRTPLRWTKNQILPEI